MAEPEMRRVALRDLTLSVRDHPGGAPPLLALHGLGSNARWWDLVAARLSPRNRVIAPDLRGHGLSDKPETGYGFTQVTGDLLELTSALGLHRFVVMGHSWGASVALALAAETPERTLAVICVDGGFTDVRAYFGPDWSVAERTMRPPDLRGVSPAGVRAWLDGSPLAEGSDPDTAAAILLGNFEPEPDSPATLRPRLSVERHMQIAKALYELDLDVLLRRVACRVLFVPAGNGAGAASLKVEGLERAVRMLGDRATVAWVEGEHDLPVQRPAELSAAVSFFLKEERLSG
jgi:pimeloyl-ACP methyl ester carboxylesterase